MLVPFFTHRREYLRRKDDFLRAVDACLRSPRLLFGTRVPELEARIAGIFGVPYAVGVASGTDALALALRALGIGEGDEVITVANTAVPTVAAIRMAGAMPRFVDVRRETLLMDVSEIEEAITERTKAILPVHLFGNAVAMDDVLAIAKAHRLSVVEDCAQAFGTTINGPARTLFGTGGRPVGSFGDVGCLSFYPTKNLGAWGDGGMCVTRRADIAERLRALRQYGFDERSCAQCEGVNSRLDELQAAVLLTKLSTVTEDLARRREIARSYDAAIEGTEFERVATGSGAAHSFHLYVVRHPDRDNARSALRERGIETAIHYPLPIHLMPAYAFLGYEAGSFPVTEQAANEILSLPIFPLLTDEEVEGVVEGIVSVTVCSCSPVASRRLS